MPETYLAQLICKIKDKCDKDGHFIESIIDYPLPPVTLEIHYSWCYHLGKDKDTSFSGKEPKDVVNTLERDGLPLRSLIQKYNLGCDIPSQLRRYPENIKVVIKFITIKIEDELPWD